MASLVIVSLGTLSGALLEASARRGCFDRIVVASRSLAKASAKANNARIGAAMEGCFPEIEAVEFDMHAADAPARLRDLGGDVIFSAPSMMPWWRLTGDAARGRTRITDAPFATFIACHLAPMLKLRDVVAASGTKAHWVGASSPDLVNAVLARTGLAPVCGSGNVAEVIPKIRLALATRFAAPPDEFTIRLVAQHAFEYFCFGDGTGQPPPYLLSARRGVEDVSAVAAESLFTPYPFPFELDFNRVTVSATHDVLEGLVSSDPIRTHAPSPGGLIGGYPVSVSADGVTLDLDESWSEAEAIAINADSLPFDGVEGLDDDGTIHFTHATAEAINAITGCAWPSLPPDAAGTLADALVNAVSQRT